MFRTRALVIANWVENWNISKSPVLPSKQRHQPQDYLDPGSSKHIPVMAYLVEESNCMSPKQGIELGDSLIHR